MSRLLDELAKRVLFMDGAMGTSIHEYDLDIEKDYLGRENCTEALVLSRPDVIREIHESFLAVGSDAVETDTFNSSVITMEDQDLQDRVHELNVKAAEIAREACEKYSTPDKPRFVVGSIGPGTKLVSLGNTTWDEMLESYAEQARGLIDGGVDVMLVETAQDLLQVKCAVNACLKALEEKRKTPDDIPIMVQVTIEQTGTMLMGSEIAAVVNALAPLPIMSLGMNCATGPTEMAEHIQYLAEYWDRAISILPNAGIPSLVEGRTEFPLKPDSFADQMAEYIERFGLNIVGGCCGTTPGHIKQLIEKVGVCQASKPEKKAMPAACCSLYTPTEYRQELSVLNVGERCNSSGSRAFKRLLEEEAWDEMVSLARKQMRQGSHVLDVNVDYAGRDNVADMSEVVTRFVRQVNAPLMLDSTQPKIIEAGLKHAGGKCIINSGNLEDGEEKFAEMIGLAKTYGAAIVLGCIDEDPEEAMARTADRKISIAERMYDLAVNKYGLPSHDIFFDPLVLPISTGMDKDRRSALELIEGTKRIAERFPEVQITCGLSNVSFGLKPVARVVLNSVFLSELIAAGMTSGILHASKIVPKNKIEDELWNAALDLIHNRWPETPVTLTDGTETTDPLQIFVDLFPDDATIASAKQDISELPLEDRLRAHIIDGEKQQLVENLEEARNKYTPLEIINDHLLDGMKVVGELFGSGQMQLPFVLQSAEVMKMAVAHLEQYMDKIEGETKGTIVLATVKGDVHDIGKNLVDIILSNNGYTVHNLGIKQPISAISEAFHEHKADAIGLSGLLVKSVNVMEENLRELVNQKVDVPILLGGAALARNYCESHLRNVYAEGNGHVYYGKDAFDGLRLMDHIATGQDEVLNTEITDRLEKRAEVDAKIEAASESDGGMAVAVATRSEVSTDIDLPAAPFWGDRVVETVKLDDVYAFINKIALYRGQWQFKKAKKTDDEYAAMLEDDVDPILERLKALCRDESILQPKVVYGYFPCNSDGNDLIVFDPTDHEKEVERFSFPRQAGKKNLCISDFFRSIESGEKDVIGMTCVTVGDEVSKRAKVLFEENNYSEYLYLHGFGVEAAEALAEMWHKRIRQELGMAGDDASTIRQLFTQNYRGSRYSFGYPACPDMSDQEKLFRLLKPHRIGCELTENWQIDPEQSTSAIIVHHPEAKYFNV